jgi:hypothetical protein
MSEKKGCQQIRPILTHLAQRYSDKNIYYWWKKRSALYNFTTASWWEKD